MIDNAMQNGLTIDGKNIAFDCDSTDPAVRLKEFENVLRQNNINIDDLNASDISYLLTGKVSYIEDAAVLESIDDVASVADNVNARYRGVASSNIGYLSEDLPLDDDNIDIRLDLLLKRIGEDNMEMFSAQGLITSGSNEEYNMFLRYIDNGYSVNDAVVLTKLSQEEGFLYLSIGKTSSAEELEVLKAEVEKIDDLNLKSLLKQHIEEKNELLSKTIGKIQTVAQEDIKKTLFSLGCEETSDGKIKFEFPEDFIQKAGILSSPEYKYSSEDVIKYLNQELTMQDVENIQKLLSIGNGKYKNLLAEKPYEIMLLYRSISKEYMGATFDDVFNIYNENQIISILDAINSNIDTNTLSVLHDYKSKHGDVINGFLSQISKMSDWEIKAHDVYDSSTGRVILKIDEFFNSTHTSTSFNVHRGEGLEVFDTVILQNGEKLSDVMSRLQRTQDTGLINNLIKEIREGSYTVNQPRYLSTSFNYETYSNLDVNWDITVPEGSKGVFIEALPIGLSGGLDSFRGESEFLMPRGLSISIDDLFFDVINNTWQVKGSVIN